MNKNSRIYIAGHSGFIGSNLVNRLKELMYRNLIVREHKDLDLTNQQKTDLFFKQEKPEYVFLLAAKVGGILANMTHPLDFLYQNLAIQNNVMHAAYKYRVKKLLFPGSACMYPKICSQPIKAQALLTGPIEPTNEPFALAKICGIKMCQAFNAQYKTNFICAVPSTVYGPGDHFDLNGHVISGLIERMYESKLRHSRKITIWGSGAPKREFIYIGDTVTALIFLMHSYSGKEIIHIGTGKEVTIKRLAELLKRILKLKATLIFDSSKPDGMPRRILDSRVISFLGWRPTIELENGLKLTSEWYEKHRLFHKR